MTIVAAAYQVGEMTISVPRPGRTTSYGEPAATPWPGFSPTMASSSTDWLQSRTSVSVVSRAYV